MRHCSTCVCPDVVARDKKIPVTHWLVDLCYLTRQSEPVWPGAWEKQSPELVRLVENGYASLKIGIDGREGVVIAPKGRAAIEQQQDALTASGYLSPRP